MSLPLISITQGDPLGIGPEIILKALEKPSLHRVCHPLIVGEPKLFSKQKKSKSVIILPPDQKQYKNSAYASLSLATKLCLQNKVSAIVTAPVNKKQISIDENISFLGHTEYFGVQCTLFYKKLFLPTMLFVGKAGKRSEKLALVTTHIPLKNVPSLISEKLLKKTISNVHEGLISLFSIQHPSLALLGLNPHAGEEGLMGLEEISSFKKILTWAKKKKILLHGPFPADSFFVKKWVQFDVTISPFHDQGLPPFKLRNFPRSVNVTLGLPIIRTSVDHGVGYDIAHTGKADASSMIEAITLAAQLASRERSINPKRRNYSHNIKYALR